MSRSRPDPAWPELPWREWQPTMATLHLWLQIVGKVRMALTPPLNHWWHITLYATARGLTTSPVPFRNRQFQIDFDFLGHRLLVVDSAGGSFGMKLEPKSVARFYTELMEGLRGLDIDARIATKPVEVLEAIPFELDETHADYDAEHARLFWRGLLEADRAMKAFQSGFNGKASPAHLFWGGLDHATSRYSDRSAPRHPGGVPNSPDWVMEEAYAREESALGWWPLFPEIGPAFYAYTYPEPDGYRSASVAPAGAFFDTSWGEFILPYDTIRAQADPDAAAQEFFRTTYAVGADLAGWDRRELEPPALPDQPPKKPWTVKDPGP
jgi:hypothetical protein